MEIEPAFSAAEWPDEESANHGSVRVPQASGLPLDGVIFTTAGPSFAAQALATVESGAAVVGAGCCVVLAAPSVADHFNSFTVLLPSEVLPETPVASSVLSDDEIVAYAEPFALARLLEETTAVYRIAPGAILIEQPEALAHLLATSDLALAAPVVARPRYSSVPNLALRDPAERVSDIVLGLTGGAQRFLDQWKAAMTDTLFDPTWESPVTVTGRVFGSFVGMPGVGIEGSATIMSWSDYAAMGSGAAQAAEPAVVDTRSLWEVVRREGGGEEGPAAIEYHLIDLRVHDTTPLAAISSVLRAADRAVGRRAAPTPYDRLTEAVRLASDPLGLRWGPDESELFEQWLFERNRLGVPRLADLVWYESEGITQRFPEARSDPTRYREWSDRVLPSVIGFDPFGEPGQASGSGTWDIPGERSPRLKDALAWRWNTIRSVLPHIGAVRARIGDRAGPVSDGPNRAIDPKRAQEIEQAHIGGFERLPSPWGESPRDLTLIGCFRTESGLGQAARASVAAVRHLGIPFTQIDTSDTFAARNHVDVGLDRESHGAVGDVNLIHSNAAELITSNDGVLRHRLGGRFNAAMWFWEARNLPTWKLGAFDRVDELWVASEYLGDVFGQYQRVPVHVVGLPSDLPGERTVDRQALGWSDDEFVFLFAYDAFSSRMRKNPEKALSAFAAAFGPRYENVRFVIKVSNLGKFPADRDRLMKLAAAGPAIEIIDAYYEQGQVYDLMAAADVYVSLHAAEGYGLTLLEAMSLGTPVICTGYSGNLDFTSNENSWLVNYTLIETVEQSGPYPPGSIWADPSIDHAAGLMRRAVSNPDEVRAKAARAREAAVHAASLERYAERLGAQLRRVL